MAELGKTLKVTGLPTGFEEDRLKDKLLIHFMQTRNGGGEIESLTIDKATPISALITYEDSAVAQRVIQQGRHTLEVDGKKYKLTATEHCERLHPDKVILRLAATIDYRQLPGGIRAVTGLQTSHPDVQISFPKYQLCTLNGSYSRVQTALAQLLEHYGSSQSAENKDSVKPATTPYRSGQTTHYTQESEYQSKKHHKQMEKREKVRLDPQFDEWDSGLDRDRASTGYGREDTAQTLNPVLQVSEQPTTPEEDLSLIVDADMFQYLQKHCQKEYQHILKKFGVEVVDMTNQGLTTLYLQVANAGGEGGPELLKAARNAMSMFLQKNESKICRSQLLKSILSSRGVLRKALENLSVKFPKLLLKEDETNIYIIGGSSDVSEARRWLLLDFDKLRGEKDDVASLFGFPSYDSSSLNPAGGERAPFTMSTPEDTLDDRINDILRSEEDEKRSEAAKKYKLAARFKDSGLAALGNRPTDYPFRGPSPSSRLLGSGLMSKYDVLSGATGHSGERASPALALNTNKDILFRSGNHVPSTVSLPMKSGLNQNFIEPQSKSQTSPLSTTQSSLGPALLPEGSGPSVRRANSFSGTPQQKAQLMDQKSKDDSSKSAVRPKASFGTNTETNVHHVEIRAPWKLWKHIKEAYSFQLDDLTSDVQMKESHPESGDLTVTLRGASAPTVRSCQLALQELIESVSEDFSENLLPLSELGVTSSADETLQACCAEVRSRFKKVTILMTKKDLLLLGPELLCSQVAATLLEVFSGDMSQISEQQTLSSFSSSSFSQINKDQLTSLHYNSKAGAAAQTGGGQKWRTNHASDFNETDLNGSVNESSAKKHAVIKEKVKLTSAVERDEQKTDTGVNYLTAGCDKSEVKHANGVDSTTGRTDKDVAPQNKGRNAHSATSESTEQGHLDIPKESRSSREHLDRVCVCGRKESSLVRTECGVMLCSECLDTVHARCRVCHKADLTPEGVRGRMSSSRLQMSIPGHKKDLVIKITYNIPDGVQAEGHPSPGKPFKGGVFEAYLPDCESARRLLPRLQEAFRQGLTFTVAGKGTDARVTWDGIPHKTQVFGGKSGCGYPDTTYLSRLSHILASNGIQ